MTLAETGTLEAVLQNEAHNMVISRFDADHSEAVSAFVEKRPANFTGH